MADCDLKPRKKGPISFQREEFKRLRRKDRQLRLEREILSKAAVWCAWEMNTITPEGSVSSAHARRVYAELTAKGILVGRTHIARLMSRKQVLPVSADASSCHNYSCPRTDRTSKVVQN